MLREFFENHVRGNYNDWERCQDDERLAKNLIGELNNMAERVFHYWHDIDPAEIGNTSSASAYRNYLAGRICGDFGIIRDVAEAHKHVELDRPSKRVTRADQTGPGHIGWDEGLWDETRWDGPKELIIELDDGSKRPLRAVVQNVMEMWENLLSKWRI